MSEADLLGAVFAWQLACLENDPEIMYRECKIGAGTGWIGRDGVLFVFSGNGVTELGEIKSE